MPAVRAVTAEDWPQFRIGLLDHASDAIHLPLRRLAILVAHDRPTTADRQARSQEQARRRRTREPGTAALVRQTDAVLQGLARTRGSRASASRQPRERADAQGVRARCTRA